jgi:hypothetical protein
MAKRERRNSGGKLRAIRQQLGWSLRDVHAASVALAKKHRQPAFVIPPSRLHSIERKNKIPSIPPLVRAGMRRIRGEHRNQSHQEWPLPKGLWFSSESVIHPPLSRMGAYFLGQIMREVTELLARQQIAVLRNGAEDLNGVGIFAIVRLSLEL